MRIISKKKRSVKQLTDNKFVNLKEVKDPSKGVNGFQFAERLGVDSVAFICYDVKKQSVLLNEEYKVPIDQFIMGAFGGSIDKDKALKKIVIDEAKEEAGFAVTEKDILDCGKYLVSTQMNQFCYLYIVKVNKDEEGDKASENEVEAMSKTKWYDIYDDALDELEDWKATVLMGEIYSDVESKKESE